MHYWAEKYLLLRKYSIPVQLNIRLSAAISECFLPFTILLYTGGCLLFENQIFGEINLVAWIQAVYSILQFIRPIDKCFGSFINENRIKFKDQSKKQYKDMEIYFLDDYDRSNPIT